MNDFDPQAMVQARRACAWPHRPRPGPVRYIGRDELIRWVLHEDERLLAVDKPGDVVCHPSKDGPWSSLVGAVREYTGLATVHPIFRLDRETSGVMLLAKDATTASRLQQALQRRRVGKRYLALVEGAWTAPQTVNQPLGPDLSSPVYVKSAVRAGPDSQEALTHFNPVALGRGFTLVEVRPETGRKHQIRAHAHWCGHPVVGDKIYGPDDRLFLEFIERGWTPELAARLHLPRQALHCAEIDLQPAGWPLVLRAPLPADWREFGQQYGLPLG